MSNPAGHAHVRDSAEIQSLLLAMRAESLKVRNAAKTRLLQRGPVREVIECLEEALRDNGDAERRNSAMEVFTSFGGDSLPVLSRFV